MVIEDIYQYRTGGDQIRDEKQSESVLDRIEFNNGIQMYVKDEEYPLKGLPTPDSLFALNQIKKLIRCSLYLPYMYLAVFFQKRTIEQFESIAFNIMSPHIIKDEYLTPTARELKKLIINIGYSEKFATLISHILEYDVAYRFRFQDLCSETTKEKLCKHPLLEIRRLIAINKKRDYNIVSSKLHLFANFVSLVVLFKPSIKKAIEKSDFNNFQLDKADKHWCIKRTDYNFSHLK